MARAAAQRKTRPQAPDEPKLVQCRRKGCKVWHAPGTHSAKDCAELARLRVEWVKPPATLIGHAERMRRGTEARAAVLDFIRARIAAGGALYGRRQLGRLIEHLGCELQGLTEPAWLTAPATTPPPRTHRRAGR